MDAGEREDVEGTVFVPSQYWMDAVFMFLLNHLGESYPTKELMEHQNVLIHMPSDAPLPSL
jgi:hypothetical protein